MSQFNPDEMELDELDQFLQVLRYRGVMAFSRTTKDDETVLSVQFFPGYHHEGPEAPLLE